MPLDSFLTFFSLSSHLNELDEETDREFFRWFYNDFVRFRPGYLFQPTASEKLHEKYRLLILDLRAHGRVLEQKTKKEFDRDAEEISAIPEELMPHIYFSTTKPTGTSGQLKTARIPDITSETHRKGDFDNLSMRYGIKIPKARLYEKIAMIGQAGRAAASYLGSGAKLKVEIFDPYYDPAFLYKVLCEKIEQTKHLSLRFHFCDLAVVKRIPGAESMTAGALKEICRKRVRAQLMEDWKLIEAGISTTSLKNLWLTGRNLQLCHWQPKDTTGSSRKYESLIRNAFHRRLIRIDGKYHLKSDHSFHFPKEPAGKFDEPIGFSHEQEKEFAEWADQREFEAQRLLINGQPCFSTD